MTRRAAPIALKEDDLCLAYYHHKPTNIFTWLKATILEIQVHPQEGNRAKKYFKVLFHDLGSGKEEVILEEHEVTHCPKTIVVEGPNRVAKAAVPIIRRPKENQQKDQPKVVAVRDDDVESDVGATPVKKFKLPGSSGPRSPVVKPKV
jgi:hypothetical protein